MDGGEPHELDVLSPIEGTYRSDNLFDFPESYEKIHTKYCKTVLGLKKTACNISTLSLLLPL
jgi:hypothetical protein